MADETRRMTQEQLDKQRCAQFLLQMIEKYGAEIHDKVWKQNTENE